MAYPKANGKYGEGSILPLKIIKAKATVEMNAGDLPEDVYIEALRLGMEVLANRKMSKVTKAELGTEDAVKAKAMEVAEANVKDILSGNIKYAGAKPKKASGAVMTEARRIARNLVKDEIKKAGLKVSHFEASEITKAANAMIDADASIIAKAEANLADREATGSKVDIIGLIKPSEKLVKAAEARKVAAKSTLSAKQAGMVATAAKPKAKPAGATAH